MKIFFTNNNSIFWFFQEKLKIYLKLTLKVAVVRPHINIAGIQSEKVIYTKNKLFFDNAYNYTLCGEIIFGWNSPDPISDDRQCCSVAPQRASGWFPKLFLLDLPKVVNLSSPLLMLNSRSIVLWRHVVVKTTNFKMKKIT